MAGNYLWASTILVSGKVFIFRGGRRADALFGKRRYEEVGPEGLLDLSSRPHGCSHATPEKTENAILVLRSKHPSWGARKLKARLEQLEPSVEWPAASTFGNILQRAGLTSPKRRKRRTTPYSEPFSEVTAPNQLWCMDFKGYRLPDGLEPGKGDMRSGDAGVRNAITNPNRQWSTICWYRACWGYLSSRLDG